MALLARHRTGSDDSRLAEMILPFLLHTDYHSDLMQPMILSTPSTGILVAHSAVRTSFVFDQFGGSDYACTCTKVWRRNKLNGSATGSSLG